MYRTLFNLTKKLTFQTLDLKKQKNDTDYKDYYSAAKELN